MTESTDETLSHICENPACGKRFHLRHYTNQYTRGLGSQADLGRPVLAKYCSPACRKDASRARKNAATHPSQPRTPDACVAAPQPAPPASAGPSSNDGAITGNFHINPPRNPWKTAEEIDTSIPDLLRRT